MPHADAGAAFAELVGIMARLRAPDGCPWDRAQSLRSLARFVLEEAAEVVDAIEREDADDLREEVGDLIFEGVFLAQVSQDGGGFGVTAALESVCAKLIRRHPHIFADAASLTPEQVKDQWDAIKAQEKAGRHAAPPSLLDGIPLAEPALARARSICSRVAQVGFDWPTATAVLDKLDEETREVHAAIDGGDRDAIEDEIGDMLFVIANLARKLDIDAEAALRRANRKFIRRFTSVEAQLAAAGLSLQQATLDQMEAAWQTTKRAEADQAQGFPPDR